MRVSLFKAVATDVPAYPLNFFTMPKSWCLDIDRAFKNFWWGFQPEKKRNLTLKAWSSICSSKAGGALGILSMRELNIAFGK